MGFFTSAFEIWLVVTNNNHEETTIEHLLIGYSVVCSYSWMFSLLWLSGRPYSSFISNFRCVVNVVFLLGDSSASEFYVPTFQDTMSHLPRSCEQDIRRWERVFRNTGTQNSDTEESPKGKNTTDHIELIGESMKGFALVSVLKHTVCNKMIQNELVLSPLFCNGPSTKFSVTKHLEAFSYCQPRFLCTFKELTIHCNKHDLKFPIKKKLFEHTSFVPHTK